jgi:hypothetical protein
VSNLNLNPIKQAIPADVCFTDYYPCNMANLEKVYTGEVGYAKDGLLFVHRDSPYLHGLNPNVLIWKDAHVSPYFLMECEENK